ncbi:MAG: DUF3054 domain-containing protein [Micrococcaceae bacterium]
MANASKAVLTLLLDAVLIVLFAGLGRRSHDLGLDLPGILLTAAPFLSAWLVAVLLTRGWDTWRAVWPHGVVVWIITVAGGLVLRVTVFGDTAAVSFQVVAACALGILLLGRRTLTTLLRRRRSPRAQRQS